MTGPRRRSAVSADPGLNYAAIGATMARDLLAFPPQGFRAAEHRHRIGSGPHRFAAAARTLMTWGGLRAAGFSVDDVRAEPASASAHGAVRGLGPRFLDDGTPWITPGMTAVVSADVESWSGPVKVLHVIEERTRVGFVVGSMPGHTACGERLIAVEYDGEGDGSVWATMRSIWQPTATRWRPAAKASETRWRRSDERVVRALHPSYVA